MFRAVVQLKTIVQQNRIIIIIIIPAYRDCFLAALGVKSTSVGKEKRLLAQVHLSTFTVAHFTSGRLNRCLYGSIYEPR